MQLYLIRHAESENNASPVHLRQEDPPISPLGALQAKSLAHWAKTQQIDQLITSPFLRTLQTTRMIVDETLQHVHVWHDLFEEGGCYQGHGQNTKGAPGMGRRAIIRQACQDAANCSIDDTIGEDGWWTRPDRESGEQAAVRAAKVAERLRAALGGSEKTIVAVIHADLKRLLLAKMLSPAVDVAALGALRNVGITKLICSDSTWTLDCFNSVSHLPGHLVGRGEGYLGN